MRKAPSSQSEPAPLVNPWQRPRSVKELADWSDTYSDFGYNTKDFLHIVHYARRDGKKLAPLFEQEPRQLDALFPEGAICDAFLAAMTDYFCRKGGIPTPGWALAPSRALADPWFSPPGPAFRATLFRDTPSAFKDKNIFIYENALTVA
jgi:hypothetical protein